MGAAAYKVETCFCANCFRFTDHHIYESKDRNKIGERIVRGAMGEYTEYEWENVERIEQYCTRCRNSTFKIKRYKDGECLIF